MTEPDYVTKLERFYKLKRAIKRGRFPEYNAWRLRRLIRTMDKVTVRMMHQDYIKLSAGRD